MEPVPIQPIASGFQPGSPETPALHAVKGEPLIELQHVDVALNGKTILRDLNWALRAGEHWSVLGANGSGKSTFLRMLRGEIAPVPRRGKRVYRLDALPQTTAVGVKEQIALVSPESQERYLRQEWRLTAQDVIHTGFAQSDLLYVKLTRDQKENAEAIAERLHIAPLLGRDMQTLSTGELRKLLIARALVGHPNILLLDEVCDGLDAAFRREMLKFIDDIARHGTQIIYTTHRADEELPAITHVATLDRGRLTETGKRLNGSLASAPCRHAPFSKTRQDAGGTLLIDIANADVFLDRKKMLRDVQWQLRSGENWVVLGGNGAGKTTFLKLVASELYPATGARVKRFGLTPRNTIWDLRQRIGTVSPLLQTHYREQLTTRQVVASGFFSSVGLMDAVTPTQHRRVRRLMNSFDITHLASRRMDELSFGELRKILTLRALVHQPQLLIFDEPFDGLDAASRRDFADALNRVAAEEGTQLLIVTHHLDDVPGCISHGLFLERGRIAASGPWPDLRKHPKVVELFGAA